MLVQPPIIVTSECVSPHHIFFRSWYTCSWLIRQEIAVSVINNVAFHCYFIISLFNNWKNFT